MGVCTYCDGTGHVEDCPAREPVEDFADLVMRYAGCPRCCPRGCADASEIQQAARKAQAFIVPLVGPVVGRSSAAPRRAHRPARSGGERGEGR